MAPGGGKRDEKEVDAQRSSSVTFVLYSYVMHVLPPVMSRCKSLAHGFKVTHRFCQVAQAAMRRLFGTIGLLNHPPSFCIVEQEQELDPITAPMLK